MFHLFVDSPLNVVLRVSSMSFEILVFVLSNGVPDVGVSVSQLIVNASTKVVSIASKLAVGGHRGAEGSRGVSLLVPAVGNVFLFLVGFESGSAELSRNSEAALFGLVLVQEAVSAFLHNARNVGLRLHDLGRNVDRP